MSQSLHKIGVARELRWLTRGKAGRWLVALLVLAFLRGLLYTFVVPVWQHPDETTQYEQVRYIAERHKFGDMSTVDLPIRTEIAASMRAHWYWGPTPISLSDPNLATPGVSAIGVSTFSQPKLYYLVGAAWLTPWLGTSIEVQLWALRGLAVLLYALVAAPSFLAVRIVYPENLALAVAATGLVVFLPGLTDNMSSVNNDVLTNALAAGIFLISAWVFRRGAGWKSPLLLVLLLAAAVLTKTTALVLVAAVPFGLALFLLSRPSRTARKLGLGLGALFLVGSVVLGFGLASGTSSLAGFEAMLGQYVRADIPKSFQLMVNPGRMGVYLETAGIVFRSFWAVFGWRGVELAPGWYWVPLAGMIIGAVGLFGFAWRRSAPSRSKPRPWRSGFLGLTVILVVVAWGLSVLRSQAYQGPKLYLSHGRYAYVAIAPFALLLALGLQTWIPIRLRPASLWIYLAVLVAFDAIAFWGRLVPYYYPA
ncbi:MAG: hypothetical protein ABSF61_04115 [Anaerolineales bacterium]